MDRPGVRTNTPEHAAKLRGGAWQEAGGRQNYLTVTQPTLCRKKAPPRKAGIACKVFWVKDRKLYPPAVANPGGESTPVGMWPDAGIGQSAPPSKAVRPRVQAGGKGTNAELRES